MRLEKIIRLYSKHSISVSGIKGSGKDMLQGNIIIRRGLPYASNVNYGGDWRPFKYEDIDIGNDYDNFIHGNIKRYISPYEDGCDLYLSDCGVYFPSQYCNELNKKYKSLPVYMALSRQTSNSAVHTNCQRLGRVWDKIREQSDLYILCRKVFYIKPLKLVIQKITIYDKFQSCDDRRIPLRVPMPLLATRQMRLEKRLREEEYRAQHGEIKNGWLIYRNKSTYNTRIFKEILENGKD